MIRNSINHAMRHLISIKNKYENEINYSIDNSKVYRDEVLLEGKEKKELVHCKCSMNDSVTAIIKNNKGKVAVLNFASFLHPGGGFMNGSKAQEESLCAESTLYPVLKSQEKFYQRNKFLTNNCLYSDAAIYSPDIIFMRDNVEVKCDVITCASPNWSAAKKKGIRYTDNYKALRERVRFVLSVAADNDVNTLILGAWGCGVFGQDVIQLAEIFQNELSKNPYFDTVIFTSIKEFEYDAFRTVFG